jgi:hypothetical protein
MGGPVGPPEAILTRRRARRGERASPLFASERAASPERTAVLEKQHRV